MTAVLTVLGLCTSLAVHSNLYWRLATQEPGQSCKSRDVFALPEPFLREPAASASAPVVAAVFIDFSCPHCRMSVDFWRKYQATRRDLIELRFYHFPADCVGPSEHYACAAARAFQCFVPGGGHAGFEVLAQLFALQDGPAPYFGQEQLRAVAKHFAVESQDFDACQRRTGVDDAVDAHVNFAEHHGLHDRPAALLIRMINDQPATAIPLQGATKDEAFLDRNIQRLIHPTGLTKP